MQTNHKPLITAYGTAKRGFVVTNKYRKLMLRRIHEVDQRSSKELAQLLAEAKRIKDSFSKAEKP